jgi:hypothetical protein
MLGNDPDEIPTFSNFMSSGFLFLGARSFNLSEYSTVLFISEYLEHLSCTLEFAPLLNLENHINTCVISIFCSPVATCNIL